MTDTTLNNTENKFINEEEFKKYKTKIFEIEYEKFNQKISRHYIP